MIGFILGVVLNFAVAATHSTFDWQVGEIIRSWVITIGVALVLYKIHPWMLYGMIGAYAALFLWTSSVQIIGPYTCFGGYGYPH